MDSAISSIKKVQALTVVLITMRIQEFATSRVMEMEETAWKWMDTV